MIITGLVFAKHSGIKGLKVNIKLNFFIFIITLHTSVAFSNELSIQFDKKIHETNRSHLIKIFNDVASLLPEKFKRNLPKSITIKIKESSLYKEIPTNICDQLIEGDSEKKSSNFIYGEYNKYGNVLTLDQLVIDVLINGKKKAKKISCQHKNTYKQAIATIIHELAHAYDFNNGHRSVKEDFVKVSDFRKGIAGPKNLNDKSIRIPDSYEQVNIQEYYAVNFEYFILDSEYACRRPSLFKYFKNELETDPFQLRNCKVNNSVLISMASGLYTPVKIDLSRIYRIDYLSASPGNELMSGFGHSMFRIVMCGPNTVKGPNCLKDKSHHLVASFRANIEEFSINMFKGIIGKYPSVLYFMTLQEIINTYNLNEFRDLYSYPLNLSNDEMLELAQKMIEVHWNYRGSYKFFTNNCAVESLELVKKALANKTLNSEKAITPNDVLDSLIKAKLTSSDSSMIEIFKSNTEIIIKSFAEAYGHKKTNEKNDKKEFFKFIKSYSAKERRDYFENFTAYPPRLSSAHQSLVSYKNFLMRASTFILIEKKISEILLEKYAADFARILEDSNNSFALNVRELSQKFNIDSALKIENSYGIPLKIELEKVYQRQSNHNLEEYGEQMKKLFREYAPEEYDELNEIKINIDTMTSFYESSREGFIQNVEVYIADNILNFNKNKQSRDLDLPSDLNEFREYLDKNLVSKDMISDKKLKYILNNL